MDFEGWCAVGELATKLIPRASKIAGRYIARNPGPTHVAATMATCLATAAYLAQALGLERELYLGIADCLFDVRHGQKPAVPNLRLVWDATAPKGDPPS